MGKFRVIEGLRRVTVEAATSGLLAAAGLRGAAAAAPPFAAECGGPNGRVKLVVGAVACQRFHRAAVGGVSAFGYHVPPACARGRQRCPVAYLTHGTGGNYQSYLGAAGDPTPAWVAALTSGPTVQLDPLA